jgi:hypothetical protein
MMANKRNKYKNSFLSLPLLLISLMLSACGGEDLSPEAQIRKTISEMESAAEQRSLSSFMEHVSEQYNDHEGNNHKAIARYVQINFIRNQSINIFSKIQSINVEGSSASVEISVAMGSREVDLSEEGNRLKADSMHFSVLFQLDDDKWLVKSVSWRRCW